MPTVIGINQVPPNDPRRTTGDYFGQLYGGTNRILLDAVLAAITGGAYRPGQVPTSISQRNPGTFNFPPGSQSPLEAQQIQQLGGVPTNAGVMARSTQIPSGAGVTYSPPTKLGLQPDFSKVLEQLKIQEAQRSLDPNSPDNKVKEATARLYGSYADQLSPKSSTTPPIPTSVPPELLSSLSNLALQGDEDAIALLRKLGAL